MATHAKSEIPPQVYAAYNLLFNNVTYRAVRKALEESASYVPLSNDKPSAEFINEIMNRLIDASLERCGAAYYQGAEADLMLQLRPLDSHFGSLVRRHLINFGPSSESAARPTSELLQGTRAELHGMQHDLQRDTTANAQIAAQWLRAAALLTGVAGDLVHELDYPITANRHAARAKLLAAFEAIEQGIVAALAEAYPLPDALDDLLTRMLRHLTPSRAE